MRTSALLCAGLAAASPMVMERATPAAGLATVSTELFSTLSKYGSYAAASEPDNCKVPPYNSTVLAYLNVASTDTQATLFRDDHAQEIILSLRGSTSLPDFLTDFTFFPVNYTGCAGCEAHVGFYTAWKSIAANARAAIDKAQAASPKYALVITGHSLGGALSQLAFAGLSDVGYKIKYGWSYGQPRDGNQAYADYIDRLSGSTDAHTGTFYRVTHANDGVPQLPPTSAGFHHSRTEFWATDGTSGTPNASTTYRCPGQENPACNDGAGGLFINAAHISYPGINYATVCT